MSYKEWLEYQRTLEPTLVHWFDGELMATISLAHSEISGIAIIRVHDHGFIVMDSVFARRRYPRLYEPGHRCYDGARPITFLEPGYVFAPYIPDVTKK